ncbi:anti-sigma factor antagonist [Amycolatopsis balhimycina DSM 5908]|uniref:Anti-sigma factor antagonist n=1 Tax=Amycolatopsis balhimycina DSM 5908 TaxID=1081091 RepID=A0A428W3L9_AMYBA|nr:anti-sigma factor antagonist [Amycolatopsis balhimycina DSM 5908]
MTRLPGQAGLRVIGDVDLSTRDTWRSALDSALPSVAPALLDLSDLSFIDARGTAMLVAAAQHRTAEAPLTLLRPPAVLRRMLTLLYPAEPVKFVIEELEAS